MHAHTQYDSLSSEEVRGTFSRFDVQAIYLVLAKGLVAYLFTLLLLLREHQQGDSQIPLSLMVTAWAMQLLLAGKLDCPSQAGPSSCTALYTVSFV